MKAIKEFLERHIDTTKIEKVLDVGFGRGEFTGMLLEAIGEQVNYTGIELLPASVNAANETFKDYNVEVIEMNAADMTFDDDTFDLVCISNTLHHIENLDPVISEMKRVVKNDGYILIQEMVRDNQTDKQMTHVALHHFSAKMDQYFGRYHDQTYTRNELNELYSKYNLKPFALGEYNMSELYPIENEQEVVSNIVNSMNKGLKRIEDSNLQKELSEEFAKMAPKLIETGFASATETLALLRK